MKRISLTVAILSFLGAAVASTSLKASRPGFPVFAARTHSNSQPQIQAFMGTITRTGDQFLFRDDSTKAAYQLDDQQTASKFDGQKVRVTGTLDAANNIIRVQSIESASP